MAINSSKFGDTKTFYHKCSGITVLNVYSDYTLYLDKIMATFEQLVSIPSHLLCVGLSLFKWLHKTLVR